MRQILLPTVVAVALAGTAPALAQGEGRGGQVRYWPMREIGFPVPPDVLRLDPRPAKLRLYAAPVGGRFEQVAERPANGLDAIDNRPPGFKYTARGDGEEEFAVQLVYDDGSVSTRTENLRAEQRVVFDTRPPTIQIAAKDRYGVEWSATDENLDPEGIKLQCRWSGDRQWYEPKTRAALRARDGYTWDSLARETRTLEVRVLVKDKATNETSSRVITLPATGAAGGLRDADAAAPRTGDLVDRGSRPPADDVPGQPAIVYVNTNQLTVKSKLMHVTRSGVKAVHLYVREQSGSPGGDWKFAKAQPCQIAYEAADPLVEIPYTAPKDGRYGFIVIPESGVGRREPDPRLNSPAQQLVEVDTLPPTVKIKEILVTPGGAIGPRVEIVWEAGDRNLMPDPIVLEYAPDRTSNKWTSIAEKVPNSHRYVWEVADKSLFKFFVRIRAVDKASNTGEHIYEKEVIIDLDRPSATIDQIRPSGAPGPAAAPAERIPTPGKRPDADEIIPPPRTTGNEK